MSYSKKRSINLFPALEACFNPACLTNIISPDLLQAKYHVKFESASKNAFTEGKSIIFEGYRSGLYIFMLNYVNAYPYNLLNTVSENKSFFSRREIRGAEAARDQNGQIGWPSDQLYYEYVRDNLIKNSKATLDDLRRGQYLFGGPAVELLKGKTFYTPINPNKPMERVSVPPIIQETHPSDNLDTDFLYCQGAPSLIMKSLLLNFRQFKPSTESAGPKRKGLAVLRTREDLPTSLKELKKTLTCSENVVLI